MTTPNLSLPYLAAAQAQKHVTVNEAMDAIDGLIQLTVISTTLTAPPAGPADGDRYIIAGSATGAWTGWDGSVAQFSGGVWHRIIPPDSKRFQLRLAQINQNSPKLRVNF